MGPAVHHTMVVEIGWKSIESGVTAPKMLDMVENVCCTEMLIISLSYIHKMLVLLLRDELFMLQ